MRFVIFFSLLVAIVSWNSIAFGQDFPSSTGIQPESLEQPFFAPVDDTVVKLLFGQRDNMQCTISLWDPHRQTTKTLYTSDSDCSERAFVSDGLETLYVVRNATLHVIPFDGKKARLSLILPTQEIQSRLAKLKDEFRVQIRKAYNREDDLEWLSANPVALGYLKSGEMALAINTIGPTDGTHAYLYILRSKGTWEMVKEKACGRFDNCQFGEINGRSLDDWHFKRAIWHEQHRENHFLLSKEIQIERGTEYDYKNATIQFKINNQISALTYTTISGPDTGATLTLGVGLRIGDGEKITLTDQQCKTSFALRYLLLMRFWGKAMELIDVGTGKSLFGPLAFATWVK